MIYITHKMLVLLNIHLNYLKDNIFECFLRSMILFFKFFLNFAFLKNIIFVITYNDGKSKA